MSERLPLPADLFRVRPRSTLHIEAANPGEVYRLMGLADRGNYLDAAEQAAELLRGPFRDLRLVAVYFAGSFVERGLVSLPPILDFIGSLLDDSLEAEPRAGRTLDATSKWLMRAVINQVAFHTKCRGAAWETWTQQATPELLDAISTRAEAMHANYGDNISGVAKLARWAHEKLGHAARQNLAALVERQVSASEPMFDPDPKSLEQSWDEPEPEPEPESEPEPEPESVEYQEPDSPRFPRPLPLAQPMMSGLGPDFGPDMEMDHRPGSFDHGAHHSGRDPSDPQAMVTLCSPPLSQLLDKIRGFERLVELGELDKAAIIASDIQATIEDFDPLHYLPSVFARYFELLSQIIDEVEARWTAGDSTARRVLSQYYRVDLDGFIND